jgi:hypothetical protein
MEMKEAIKSQYFASLEMLRQAIVECPDSLWYDDEYQNQFWHVAYHALFYAHLYLQPSEKDFIPWDRHREEFSSLGSSQTQQEAREPYSKEEILEYHRMCQEQVETQIASLDPEAESGFNWLPFDKLELQFYNIRHIQQHTGELCERLWATGAIEVSWVGMKPATQASPSRLRSGRRQ